MSELKPCPFCGGNRPIIRHGNPGGIVTLFYVCCLDCGAQGPQSHNETQAWDTWSHRVAGAEAVGSALDEALNMGDGTYKP